MSDDWDAIPEDFTHFEGPCTCPHDEEAHGWGSCDIEGCDCEAGWCE